MSTKTEGLQASHLIDSFVPVDVDSLGTAPIEAHSLVTAEADGFITVEEIAVTNPHSAMRGMDPMDAAHWRADVSHIIKGLGFKMCCTNNDVWHRPAVDNLGNDVNECVTAHPDDLLVHALDPAPILLHIDQHLKLKGRHIRPQAQHLCC